MIVKTEKAMAARLLSVKAAGAGWRRKRVVDTLSVTLLSLTRNKDRDKIY